MIMSSCKKKPLDVEKRCKDAISRPGSKKDRSFEIRKRDVSWTFLLVFLMGSIFGGFIAEPISDFIFFTRESTGVPLSPEEQVFYWYYLSTSVDIMIFTIGFFFMRSGRLSASTFRYSLIGFALISIFLSLIILNKENVSIGASLLLVAPNVAYAFVLYYAVRFKVEKEYVEV